MKLPYSVDDYDLQMKYYFRDVSSLLDVSADEDFKASHVEATPDVRLGPDNRRPHLGRGLPRGWEARQSWCRRGEPAVLIRGAVRHTSLGQAC